MMRSWTVMCVIVAGLVGSTAAWAQRSPGSSDAAGSFAERYGVVVDGNIFLRERGRPTAGAAPSTRPAPAPPSPERSLMLTGVVFEDGVVRAYFENLAGGPPVRVAPGEPVARGIATEIVIDAVAYQDPDGSIRWVEIGHDLTGAPAAVAAAPAPPAAPGTSARPPAAAQPAAGEAGAGSAAETSAGAAGSEDPSTLSVAERMRRNRQQQLNRN